jgi:hypothetical protein
LSEAPETKKSFFDIFGGLFDFEKKFGEDIMYF